MQSLFEIMNEGNKRHIVDRWNNSTWCGLSGKCVEISDDDPWGLPCIECTEVLDKLERLLTA